MWNVAARKSGKTEFVLDIGSCHECTLENGFAIIPLETLKPTTTNTYLHSGSSGRSRSGGACCS